MDQLRLTGWAAHSFVGGRAMLAHVRAELAPLEVAVGQAAAQDPIARALDGIPGIGPVLALMLRAEIGAIERFGHPKQLASYAGLVPRVDQSGGHCRYGPITREGSPWLRWALVEAAIQIPKRRDALGRWARRLAVQKGGLKARVAAARLLCYDVFRVWPRR